MCTEDGRNVYEGARNAFRYSEMGCTPQDVYYDVYLKSGAEVASIASDARRANESAAIDAVPHLREIIEPGDGNPPCTFEEAIPILLAAIAAERKASHIASIVAYNIWRWWMEEYDQFCEKRLADDRMIGQCEL